MTRSSTARMRGDWRTNCTPTRIALMSRSRPSGCGWCSWRQRRIDEAREHREHRVEREHPDAAGAGDQRAGDQRPDDAREVHRHAVEGQRRGELGARHQVGHDRREHRPAQRQADAVGEHQRQQQRRGHEARGRGGAQRDGGRRRARTGWPSASAAGRGCRPARRSAGPSRNTGRVEADCTSATQIGVLVSVVIVHAAATSFIHMHRLAVEPGAPEQAEHRHAQRLECGDGAEGGPAGRGRRLVRRKR